MKKRLVLSITVCISGIIMLTILGCSSNNNQNDALRGVVIPIELIYGGKVYQNTGETVAAIKIVPDNLQFIGHGTFPGDPPPSPVGDCNPVYEVYSIKGIDENEAIAVKFLLVGNSGAYYVFLEYQRQE